MNPNDTPLPPGARSAPVLAWRNGRAEQGSDLLADEVPVALVFNGLSHAVMMATPLDLEDFALGFGLTEGLLTRPSELYSVDLVVGEHGIRVEMDVAAACFARLKERRRTMAGRTGCGLCGTESLEQVRLPLQALSTRLVVRSEAITRAMAALPAMQALQHDTGATHAAAWCDPDGHVLIVREDVGRHNALDKLVGAMHRSQVNAAQGFIAITSRASFEMVQKTAMAGVSHLVAVSAPTDLARRIALEAGITLMGFARGSDFVIYTHAERIALPGR
jgi:FdhD protein